MKPPVQLPAHLALTFSFRQLILRNQPACVSASQLLGALFLEVNFLGDTILKNQQYSKMKLRLTLSQDKDIFSHFF